MPTSSWGLVDTPLNCADPSAMTHYCVHQRDGSLDSFRVISVKDSLFRSLALLGCLEIKTAVNPRKAVCLLQGQQEGKEARYRSPSPSRW